MSHSVSYNYSPNDHVYVINSLGLGMPTWPNWWFWGSNVIPAAYPNGFTSTTPAVQSGVVLQSRILFTTSSVSPSIMYDVRVTGEMGTTPFPENVVFPATPGVAGYQVTDFAGVLTLSTAVSVASHSYTDTVYINGASHTVTIDLSTTPTIAAVIAQYNAQLGGLATMTLTGGNLQVTSAEVGVSSSVVIVEPGTFPILASLPGFVGINTAVSGVASGLDQALAYYATLSL